MPMVEHPSDTQAELDALLQRIAPAIADVISRLMAVHDLSWADARKFRDEIVDLNGIAETDEEQSTLLFAFVSLMDRVEQLELIDSASLEDFRRVRRADYLMMLNVQAMVGDIIVPDRLAYVTRREIEAGRLGADDEFSAFAVQNSAPKSWFKKLFGKGR